MDFTNLKKFMDYMASVRTTGCAAAVYHENKLVFKYAAGVSDIENKTPMTGDEYFNIYSSSKMATAVAAMQFVERGIIKVNQPISDIVPEFEEMYIQNADGTLTKAKKPITFGNVLSMTAGFTYNFNSPALMAVKEANGGSMSGAELARAIAKEPLIYEPGTRWQYSIAHDVMAGLIEIMSGMSFNDYMKENVFTPLGMTKTTYRLTPWIQEKMAKQYRFVSDDPAEIGLPIEEAQRLGKGNIGHYEDVGYRKDGGHGTPGLDSGGAGIITTVEDYGKLMGALACGGKGATGKSVLSPYSIDLMRTNRLEGDVMKYYNWENYVGYGYGLGVATHMNKGRSGIPSNIGEFSWGGAAGALSMVDPTAKIGVFFAQHTLNPRESWYQPRLKAVIYSCLD